MGGRKPTIIKNQRFGVEANFRLIAGWGLEIRALRQSRAQSVKIYHVFRRVALIEICFDLVD